MKPLLTICVLTYNRAIQVDALLLYLRRSLLPAHGNDVELLVVNNCSTDDTSRLLARHVREGLRVIDRVQFLPTAEENMLGSLEYCSGEYTWFLGDDDYPNVDAFEQLLEHLRTGTPDLLVSNTASIDERGVVLNDSIVHLECASVDLGTEELVAATGMLALMAGISRLVMRTSRVRAVDGQSYLAIQTVYAHVFWLLAAFRGCPVRVLGMPLLKYTTLAPDADLLRFLKLQQRTGVGRYTYWSFGLARLIGHALNEGVLPTDVVCRAFDLTNDGRHSRLLDSLVLYGCKQVLSHFRYGGVETVGAEDYAHWRDLVLGLDPSYLPAVRVIDAIHARAGEVAPRGVRRRIAASRFEARFMTLWSALLGEDRIRSTLFRGSIHGFDLYRGPLGWVAVLRGDSAFPTSTVLRLDIAMLCGAGLRAHREREPLLQSIARESNASLQTPRRNTHSNALLSESITDAAQRVEGGMHRLNRTMAEAMFVVSLPYLLCVRLPRRAWREGRRLLGNLR